jgi:hypothetical protein
MSKRPRSSLPTDRESLPTDRRSFLAGVAASTAAALVPATAGADAGTAGTATAATTASAATAAADASFGPRARLDVPGTMEAVVGEDGTVVYVATLDGVAAVDVSDPDDPTELVRVSGIASDVDGGPLENIFDLHVAGDRLAVGGPGFGGTDLMGFAVFDVSDPASPERTAFHRTGYGIHNLFFDGQVVYLTANGRSGKPVAMVDVSGDDPERVGEFTPAPYDLYPGTIHDVYVAGDTLYACYWDLGTWLVDVSDPADPQARLRVGYDLDADADTTRNELPGNSHYAQPHPDGDVLAVGKETFEDEETEADGAPGGVELWDVSDLSAPSRETIIAPPEETADQPTGTAHNFGWRGDRLYVSWYRGGVRVYDAGDPAAPTRLAAWRDGDQGNFWTAKPVHDGFVASSTGLQHEDAAPGLFFFPEPSGDGEPVRTMEPLAPADYRADFGTGGGSTPTTPGTPDETPPDTETVIDTATTTDSPGDPGTDAGTATTAPGFGTLTALAAGGLAGWRLLRNRGE